MSSHCAGVRSASADANRQHAARSRQRPARQRQVRRRPHFDSNAATLTNGTTLRLFSATWWAWCSMYACARCRSSAAGTAPAAHFVVEQRHRAGGRLLDHRRHSAPARQRFHPVLKPMIPPPQRRPRPRHRQFAPAAHPPRGAEQTRGPGWSIHLPRPRRLRHRSASRTARSTRPHPYMRGLRRA